MADHAAYESFLAVRDDNTLRARVLPCGARGLAACPAASFAGGGFPVDRFWTAPGRYSIQVLLTLLSSGPPCVVLSDAGLEAPQSGRTFASLHAECQQANKAAVVALDNGQELLLAAVLDRHQGNVAVFAGYLVAAGAPLLVGECLAASKLQVVLDLDETLVSAQAMSGLRERYDVLSERMDGGGGDLQNLEFQLLQQDIDLLQQFADSDSVIVGGQTFQAMSELAMAEDGSPVNRPVVRLEAQGIVLTRIDPARVETSMIVRVRQGWEGLFSYLCPGGEPGSDQRAGKSRFDVYVATAAERGYALEAWRLLDPQGLLIPLDRVQRRVVCIPGSRQKRLQKVFGTREAAAAVPYAPSPMPTAVVLDDRLEVWDPSQRSQVLQVGPYFPLKEMAAAALRVGLRIQEPLPSSSWASSEELQRCQAVLTAVRSNIFYALDQAQKTRAGPGALELLDMELALPKMPAVLQQCAATATAAAPVSANGAPTMSSGGPPLQPVDPRSLPPPANPSPAPFFSRTVSLEADGPIGLKRPAGPAEEASMPSKRPAIGHAPHDPRGAPGPGIGPRVGDPRLAPPAAMAPADPRMFMRPEPPAGVGATAPPGSMPPVGPPVPPPAWRVAPPPSAAVKPEAADHELEAGELEEYGDDDEWDNDDDDHDYQPTQPQEEVPPAANLVQHNSVSLLNEAGQKAKVTITYTPGTSTRTAEGKLCWTVQVAWEGEIIGEGDGMNKKDAKKHAAYNALASLDLPRPFSHMDNVPVPRDMQIGGAPSTAK